MVTRGEGGGEWLKQVKEVKCMVMGNFACDGDNSILHTDVGIQCCTPELYIVISKRYNDLKISYCFVQALNLFLWAKNVGTILVSVGQN